MKVIYAQESLPDVQVKGLFLAGPTPRDGSTSWRAEALEILQVEGYDGTVYLPEPAKGKRFDELSWEDQVTWEHECLSRADVILFWVPRDLPDLPGFTTNVEFGMWASSGKAVLGYPSWAPHTRYLGHIAGRHSVAVCPSLKETIGEALKKIGVGSRRSGAEAKVPLLIWETSSFQSWYQSQVTSGNELLNAEVLWNFRPSGKVWCWVLKVSVWIAEESRIKDIEFVFGRTDISSCVMHYQDSVVLVKEFRSPVRNSASFVYELPGGSSQSAEDPISTVSHEIHEETGLSIAVDRFVAHGSRQVSATLSSHVASLYSVELTDEEALKIHLDDGTHGVEEDTERTYVELWSLSEIVESQLVDWSNLGMILSVLRSD